MSKLDKGKKEYYQSLKTILILRQDIYLANWDLKNLIRGRHPGQGYDFIGKVIKK